MTKMRLTLRNKLIATIGHDPIPLGEIVLRCGGKRARAEKWHSVRRELRRLAARGLVVRLRYGLWMAGDGWVTKGRCA